MEPLGMKRARRNKVLRLSLFFFLTIFVLLAKATLTPASLHQVSSSSKSKIILELKINKAKAFFASRRSNEVMLETNIFSGAVAEDKNKEERSIEWKGVPEVKQGLLEVRSNQEIKKLEAGIDREEAGEKKEEEIRLKPAFRNIKEKVGTYAFLAWLWLVIAVLLYILNEQIKEADRRHRLRL